MLTVNPQLLIFVEGTDCFNGDCYWWGGNLLGVAQFPVALNVANRLVYSPHDYGPVEFQQRWFTGSTGFQTAITLTNTSAAAISSWTLQWTFANGQQITNLWNGVLTQAGAMVTVRNAPYNGTIAAGGNTTLGFTASRTATNAIPTAFFMNAVQCQ